MKLKSIKVLLLLLFVLVVPIIPNEKEFNLLSRLTVSNQQTPPSLLSKNGEKTKIKKSNEKRSKIADEKKDEEEHMQHMLPETCSASKNKTSQIREKSR